MILDEAAICFTPDTMNCFILHLIPLLLIFYIILIILFLKLEKKIIQLNFKDSFIVIFSLFIFIWSISLLAVKLFTVLGICLG